VSESAQPLANGEPPPSLPPELEVRDGLLCYRGTNPFDSLPIPEGDDESDFSWAWNDLEVQRRYAGRVVAVAGQRVWGAGVDEDAAWEEARRQVGCPPEDKLVFVPVPGLPPESEPSQDRA